MNTWQSKAKYSYSDNSNDNSNNNSSDNSNDKHAPLRQPARTTGPEKEAVVMMFAGTTNSERDATTSIRV